MTIALAIKGSSVPDGRGVMASTIPPHRNSQGGVMSLSAAPTRNSVVSWA